MAMLLSWLHCTLSYTYTLLPDETVEVDNGEHVTDRENGRRAPAGEHTDKGGRACSTAARYIRVILG
jgi:hypothetical protein